MKKEKEIPLSIRLRENLRDWLDIRAEKNYRSLNGEVSTILEKEKKREEERKPS